MVLDSFTRLSGRESKPGPCLLHTYQRPTGWECLHNVKRQRLEGSAALSAAIYRGPLSAGLGTKLQKKQEERGKQKGIGVRTASPSRLQPYSQHCRWPVHLCHFLFLQQLPSSLLDPGRSRKAEKSPRFQVSGSEKLQIRCEKQSESESRSWFLFTQICSAIWSPRSGSSLGTGKHGGESQSKSALPEQPSKKETALFHL